MAGALTAVAVLGLVGGLLLDAAVLRPGEAGLKRLETEKARLQAEIARLSERQRDGAAVARHLGLDGGRGAGRGAGAVDPLTYLGRSISESRLERLELSTESALPGDAAGRTRFFLRVRGGYGQVVGFVRRIESDFPLGAVDSFVLQRLDDGAEIEGRLSVSIYTVASGGPS
jgi:hypothetical protein